MAVAWGTWEFVDRESGAKSWSAGAGAELLTASALSKLESHEALHGLKFSGFDVDHVVVGKSGVSAVETKWTARDVDLSARQIEPRLRQDAAGAIRGARTIETFLRHQARLDLRVRPLLVLWGAGISDVPGGRCTIEGVKVLVGRQKKEWLPSVFQGGELSEWDQAAAREALNFRQHDQI
jgi:hypothetical protein